MENQQQIRTALRQIKDGLTQRRLEYNPSTGEFEVRRESEPAHEGNMDITVFASEGFALR